MIIRDIQKAKLLIAIITGLDAEQKLYDLNNAASVKDTNDLKLLAIAAQKIIMYQKQLGEVEKRLNERGIDLIDETATKPWNEQLKWHITFVEKPTVNLAIRHPKSLKHFLWAIFKKITYRFE